MAVAQHLDTADLARLVVLVGAMAAPVDDADRVERVRQLERLKAAAAAAQQAVAVELIDSRRAESAARGEPVRRQRQAATAAAHEIGLARRVSPAQARRWVGNARILKAELPLTFAALASGATSEWRALVVARETVFLSRHHRAVVDRDLAPRLEQLGDAAVEAEARRHAQRLDPAGAAERARNAVGDRRVSLRPAPDTMCRLSTLVPVAQGVAAYAALKQRADTLIERVTGLTAATDVNVEVNLVMTDRALFGSAGQEGADEPAVVPGYGPLPSPVARDLALSATGTATRWIRRLYLTPDDSRLMTMDSRRREFSPTAAHFVRTRDHGTCRTLGATPRPVISITSRTGRGRDVRPSRTRRVTASRAITRNRHLAGAPVHDRTAPS